LSNRRISLLALLSRPIGGRRPFDELLISVSAGFGKVEDSDVGVTASDKMFLFPSEVLRKTVCDY
jgi:hypothetical protein